MPQDAVKGAKVEAQRRLNFLSLGAFNANATKTPNHRFGCPPGMAGIRILGIYMVADDIPSDVDGTLVLNAIVNDVSEGGDDNLITSGDLETLILAAEQWYECPLDAETSEKERTLYPGDALRIELVSDSAAIDTNPVVNVMIEWHPIPDLADLERVGRPTDYQP